MTTCHMICFFGHSQSLQGSVDGNRGQPLDAHNFRETLIVAHPVAPYWTMVLIVSLPSTQPKKTGTPTHCQPGAPSSIGAPFKQRKRDHWVQWIWTVLREQFLEAVGLNDGDLTRDFSPPNPTSLTSQTYWNTLEESTFLVRFLWIVVLLGCWGSCPHDINIFWECFGPQKHTTKDSWISGDVWKTRAIIAI